jgi:hypothetical protein
MLSWVKSMFRAKTDREYVEDYLAKSISLEDLERRQRDLRQRGYIA